MTRRGTKDNNRRKTKNVSKPKRRKNVCTDTASLHYNPKLTHKSIFNPVQKRKQKQNTHNYACMYTCASHQHMWHVEWRLQKLTVPTPTRHNFECIGTPNRNPSHTWKSEAPTPTQKTQESHSHTQERHESVCTDTQNVWRTMIFNNLIQNKRQSHQYHHSQLSLTVVK